MEEGDDSDSCAGLIPMTGHPAILTEDGTVIAANSDRCVDIAIRNFVRSRFAHAGRSIKISVRTSSGEIFECDGECDP